MVQETLDYVVDEGVQKLNGGMGYSAEKLLWKEL